MTDHAFNCDGGGILYRLGAAWFISYAYYNNIDKSELSWNNECISPKSTSTRISKYNNSMEFHHTWASFVLSMDDKRLSTPTSKVGLSAYDIKRMANELLKRGF